MTFGEMMKKTRDKLKEFEAHRDEKVRSGESEADRRSIFDSEESTYDLLHQELGELFGEIYKQPWFGTVPDVWVQEIPSEIAERVELFLRIDFNQGSGSDPS